MGKEYFSAGFDTVKGYFVGFDASDIKNYYYVNLTKNGENVPRPTAYIIEVYF